MSESTNVNFKKTAAAETQYSTGAQRDSRSGKGAFHWMPWDAVWLVSNIYENGNKGRSKNAAKDGHDRNWENCMPILDFLQSALNHITAHISGDRSEAHISMAVWNLLNYLQTSIWITLGFRSPELNKLPNHRVPWNASTDAPAPPLSPREIEWLQFKGVLPKPLVLVGDPPVTVADDGKGNVTITLPADANPNPPGPVGEPPVNPQGAAPAPAKKTMKKFEDEDEV